MFDLNPNPEISASEVDFSASGFGGQVENKYAQIRSLPVVGLKVLILLLLAREEENAARDSDDVIFYGPELEAEESRDNNIDILRNCEILRKGLNENIEGIRIKSCVSMISLSIRVWTVSSFFK